MTAARGGTGMADDVHFYEPARGHGLRHNPLYAIVAPRPIGWISTRSSTGLNLAPYSFFNLFHDQPPLIGFASSGEKDTLNNVRETGEFCWNLATRALAAAMNASSAAVGPDVDEFALAGLTPVPGRIVAAPRVGESPVSFECRRTQIIRLEDRHGARTDSWLVLGEVVAVHIDRALLRDGVYDTTLARPIARGGGRGDYFEIGPETRFELPRPRPAPEQGVP